MLNISGKTRIIDLTVDELRRLIRSEIGIETIKPREEYNMSMAEVACELGCSKRKIQAMKDKGELDGTFLQFGRSVRFSRIKVMDKLQH